MLNVALVNPGYIYILQNPSLSESHLKIGRTERDPEQRAAEISSSTGVPTPFEVVWWSESVDCHLAETFLHHELTPFRTNATREFFDLELDDAIRVARRAIRKSGGEVAGWSYYFRRSAGWIFQSIVRPILRLPVQIVLLLGLILWWMVRTVLLVAYGILRFTARLFTYQKTSQRRRRR